MIQLSDVINYFKNRLTKSKYLKIPIFLILSDFCEQIVFIHAVNCVEHIHFIGYALSVNTLYVFRLARSVKTYLSVELFYHCNKTVCEALQ